MAGEINVQHDFWDCPVCGYRVTNTEMVQARADFGCPRCKTPRSFFKPKPKVESNDEQS